MNLRSITPLAAALSLIAFVPAACGGDSNEEGSGGKGGGGGAGDGGTAGKATGGKAGASGANATGGKSGTGGRGGTSSGGGTTSKGGNGGTAGVSGEGGVGGEGGGEAGAGGEPGCSIAEDATVSGTLKITADDNYRLYLNGTLIDETPRIWTSPQTYTVMVFRNPSRKNVIAIEGINTQEISTLDRTIIADLSFDGGAGAQNVVTDTSWKLATMMETNWFVVSFNDAAWTAAFDEGAHGIAPYGNILGTSTAHHIWAYDSNVDATAKPDPPEHIYVRKSFYVNLAGTVTGTPNACP